MIRKQICLFLAIFVLSFTGASQAALAQQSIAVIDVKKVLNESKAAQDIQKQISKQQDEFKSSLSKKEATFRDKQKKLVEGKSSLSKEEFTKKRKEFAKDLNETRNSIQKNKAALDSAFTVAMRTLEKEIFTIVQSIAIEQKYEIVLTRNNVFLGSNSLDITEETMEKLNKRLSKVKLKIEK